MSIAPSSVRTKPTLALLLFLEEADSIAVSTGHLNDVDSSTFGASWLVRKAERVLDRVVKWAQEIPKVAHVELMVLDEPALKREAKAHMATYIGDRADWRNSDEFYTKRRWRAIPLYIGVEHTLRCLCNDEVGAPYSLSQYLANAPPLRWVPRMWRSREQQTPSHCACLVARIMCRANIIQAEPALLTPSSLHNLMLQTCSMTRSSLETTSNAPFVTTASEIEVMDDATLRQCSLDQRLHLLHDLVYRTATACERASVPNQNFSHVALENDDLCMLQRRLGIQALRLLRI